MKPSMLVSLSLVLTAFGLTGCPPTPCDRFKSLKTCNSRCMTCLGTGPGSICLDQFQQALTLSECAQMRGCLDGCPGATTDGGSSTPSCTVTQDCTCSNNCYNAAPNSCRQAYDNYAGCVTRQCGGECR